MPRLLHLNGPPGIGKSTLARRYVGDHPLSFCLDIDGFRRLIGGWEAQPGESGRLARRMALAMAREHLAGGHDVVVPQFVARPEFARQLFRVATDASAEFYEVVLLDSPAEAAARFAARADDPAWIEHHQVAARMIAASGGFATMYDALMNVIDELPGLVKIMTEAGAEDAAYRSLLKALDGPA